MKPEATVAAREVDTFEEYTLYSLERSTPTLLRMMERGKRVANQWPEVVALMEAAGLCQEVAALASFQETLDSVFQFGGMDNASGEEWRRMRDGLKRMMDSLEGALSLNDPGVIKQIFAIELPEALNRFIEVIPMVVRHVRETYMAANSGETIPAGVGEEA